MAQSKRTFGAEDFAVFSFMLLLSAAIGIFYCIRSRRSKKGTEGYLLASRSMDAIPVAISLTVSFQSAVTFLAIPAEVYRYGMFFIWSVVSVLIVAVMVSNVFIPTFYSLRISSTYEYLEHRFGRSVRLIVTTAFIIQNLVYLGLNVYGPALALNGVTGFDMTVSMLTTGAVCIFYTTLGGLKAVIWTDVFQGIIMAAGLIAFIGRGTVLIGGWNAMWTIASAGQRTNVLEFNTDVRIRYTFWSVLVGMGVLWLGIYGANQSQVQRYLCIKSERKSKRAVYLSAMGIAFYTTLACICGVVMYAYYSRCDPLSEECIRVGDQLMPYAVMDVFRGIKGLPGMYLACVFSASLSTVSSGLNAIVTVTIEDYLKPFTSWRERTYLWMAKGLAVFYGAGVLGLAFLTPLLGDIMSIGIVIVGGFGASSVGIFILGIWLPFVNTAGAISGFFSGLSITMLLHFGGKRLEKPYDLLRPLALSTDGCTETCEYMTFNGTMMLQNLTHGTPGFPEYKPVEQSALDNLFSVSYIHVSSMGFAITILVGVIVSLLTCGWRKRFDVDRSLVRLPFDAAIFSWIPARVRKFLNFGIEWPNDHFRNVGSKTDGESIEFQSISGADSKKEEANGVYEN